MSIRHGFSGRGNDYLPNSQSFKSGLPEGKSTYAPESAKGRTRREREKQAKRAQRIRTRSIEAARKK
jgi:hypothetical protein